jgi:hypothetical protein
VRRAVKLTAIEVLLDAGLDAALLRGVNGLDLHVLALGTEAARGVHALLELVAPPSEDVIGCEIVSGHSTETVSEDHTMLSVAGVVTVAEVEWLGAIRGPLSLVVEGSGVPDDLVHQLGDPDGVRRRAVSAQAKEVGGAARGVGDVRPVVGAVEILAVPAGGEVDVGADTTLADILGQMLGIEPG